MIEQSRSRHWSPGRGPSRRVGECLVSAVVLLALAILPGWLTRASAQAPGIPEQGPGPATVSPAGSRVPALQGGVPSPDAATKAEEPPTPAERLIDEAAAKIAKLRSVSATLLETVDMLNQQITIKGTFLKAPEHRIYLLLSVSGPPETKGTTLQVCDSETLWDYQAILDTPRAYRKFSIKPIMEKLNSADLSSKTREQAMNQLGFAGPETLLLGLRQDFRFEEKEDATLDGKPVWIIHGSWRNRQGLMGPDGRPVPPVGMLPPYIPSDALLYLGKEDGWPYKLSLRGRQPTTLLDTRKKGPDGRYIGSKSSIETVDPTKIVLEYSEVKLNVAIQVNEFVFQPPSDAAVEDNTEMMVRFLDAEIRKQVERKKAEATKKDGAILEPEINIPPPPGAPATPPSPQ